MGTGGVGKTRLALEVGRALAGRFPSGAAYVNLAGVEDAAMLMPAAASALGVVAETPAELGDRLARVTNGASALLVLDGFERFLADAAHVAEWLAVAPTLTVLTTSRAPLRLTAEHAYRVLPLAVSNAAALFTARVAAARSDWTPREDDRVVAEICARLDGLPLAIELAADRARRLPLPALLERLERRLELLSGGPRDLPERQRSLRATLEWSWEVLEPAERTLLARLCVFEGGASSEAFDAVCNPEGGPAETLLAAIMDKTSLVVVEAGVDAQPRLAMLDTVREFAAEQVSSDEMILLELRHAQYYLEYAERAADRAARADRRVWLSRLALERGNLRVTFERLLRMSAAKDALRIAIAFARPDLGRARARRPRLAQRDAQATPARAERAPRRGALLGRPARALAGALRRRRGTARARAPARSGARRARARRRRADRARPPRGADRRSVRGRPVRGRGGRHPAGRRAGSARRRAARARGSLRACAELAGGRRDGRRGARALSRGRRPVWHRRRAGRAGLLRHGPRASGAVRAAPQRGDRASPPARRRPPARRADDRQRLAGPGARER